MCTSPSSLRLCFSVMLTAGVDLHHRDDTPSRCLSPVWSPSSSAGGRLPLCGPAGTQAPPGCWSRCVWGRDGSGLPGRPPPPTASNRSPFEAVRPQRRREQVHLWPLDRRLWERAGWGARPGRWLPSSRGRSRSRIDTVTITTAAAECDCTPPSSHHCQAINSTLLPLNNFTIKALLTRKDIDFRSLFSPFFFIFFFSPDVAIPLHIVSFFISTRHIFGIRSKAVKIFDVSAEVKKPTCLRPRKPEQTRRMALTRPGIEYGPVRQLRQPLHHHAW